MRVLIGLCLFLLLDVVAGAQITGNTATTINLEGTVFYYTVEEEGKTLLYQAMKSDAGVWQSGSPVQSFNAHLEGTTILTPFISYDNSTLYFSAKVTGSTTFDLYYSERDGDKWQQPIKIEENISTEANEESPSVSADNMHLYFTRKAQGGDEELKNCRAIYHSTRTPSGEWGEPKLLNFPINLGCEATPLIAPDGKTLFFSSDRLSAKKKRRFTIHYSTQLATGVWSPPLPVDSLMNDYDEFSPSLDYKNKEMNLTRMEAGKKDPVADIYSFPLPAKFLQRPFTVVSGTVKHSSGKPVEATIKMIDNYSFQLLTQLKSSAKDGSYRFIIPNEGRYTAEFYTDTSSHIFRNMVTEGSADGASLRQDVTLFSQVNVVLEVYDESMMELTSAKVSAKERGGPLKIAARKEKDGRYQVSLPVGKAFELQVEKEGYAGKTIQLNLGRQQQFEELKQVVYLEPGLRSCEVRINDLMQNKPMAASVAIRNLDRNETVWATSNQVGVYVFNLRKDSRYELSIFKKDYMYFLAHWEADASRVKQTLDVKLVPLLNMGKLELQFVAFNPATTSLSSSSWGELKNLVRLLKENPDYTFLLMVPTTDTEDGKKLAAQRVVVLQAYLGKQSLPVNNYVVESVVRRVTGVESKDKQGEGRIMIQANSD